MKILQFSAPTMEYVVTIRGLVEGDAAKTRKQVEKLCHPLAGKLPGSGAVTLEIHPKARSLREAIKAGLEAGQSAAELARSLGVTQQTVSYHRKHLNGTGRPAKKKAR